MGHGSVLITSAIPGNSNLGHAQQGSSWVVKKTAGGPSVVMVQSVKVQGGWFWTTAVVGGFHEEV